MSKEKHWVECRVKGTRALVGIYYNPHNEPVAKILEMFIVPECRNEVYGYKTK